MWTGVARAEDGPLRARADLLEEYRLRGSAVPGERDQLAHLYLDLGASHASDRFSSAAAVDAWWDLDGRAPAGTPGGLGTVYSQGKPWVDVLHLTADYRGDGSLRLARLGRQDALHGRPATFDGGYLLFSPGAGPLSLFAFGGRSVHFFEVDPALFENWVAATGAGLRLGPDLRAEIEYRFLREAVPRLDAPGRTPLVGHAYGLTAWYRLPDVLQAKALVRGLDRRVAQLAGSLSLLGPAGDAGLDARASVQPVTLREIDEAENPYFLTLGESLPNARWHLDAWKALETGAGVFTAHAGFDGRRLLGGVEGPFNRNTSRVYALAEVRKLPVPGLSVSASLDHVARTLSDGGLWAIGGAVQWERGRLRLEAGSRYDRYQYQYFRTVEELSNLRAYFGEVRWRAGSVQFRARYVVEVFDRVLHTVQVGLTQSL
jgi:hypothetical protein